MQVFCKPFKCLGFLSGRRAAQEYQPVDTQAPGKDAGEDDDEDDFFGDSWEASEGSTASQAKEPAVKAQGVERNPSRETTTKRGSGSAHASPSSSSASVSAPQSLGKSNSKKDDFFSELGMVDEYRAPRIASVGASSQATQERPQTKSVSSLLEESDTQVASGGWGEDDLDLM
mmetsp:Transcript_100838/g.157510  ORF Transcript_100838/g.157510 Transcript_100838/m.157510 type:complete len:173 (-) Transcript_100838:8-526(-)